MVSFNLYITVYSFVCQFPLHNYWNSYNQKQSSGDFLQKRCSDKFNKIHKKNLCWSLVLNEIADLQHLALSKKTLWHRCFLVNFWEISQKTAFIEPLWTAFCLITHSVYYPTTTSRLNSSLRTILLWGMRSWRSKDFFYQGLPSTNVFLDVTSLYYNPDFFQKHYSILLYCKILIELKMNVYKTHHVRYVQITSCFPGNVKEPQNLGYWTNLMKQKHTQINNSKIQHNTTRSEIGPSLTIKTMKILM